jgi:hypothetical protein
VISFRSDAGRRTVENWNPLPSEIQAGAIEREFSVRWRERSASAAYTGTAPTQAKPRHTCRYLYGNIAMDANGRILPCCSAPTPEKGLVFGSVPYGGDHFNSEKYRLARLSFANPELYRMERAAVGLDWAPHCAACDWHDNQGKARVDRDQVKYYFSGVGRDVFSPISLAILSSC